MDSVSSNKLVLLVDDDENFLEILEAKLKVKDFSVARAKSGAEAQTKAKELKPAVILLDVRMQPKDGIATAIDLLNDPETKTIPIIFLTSLGDTNLTELSRKWSKELGAYDYFKKGGDYDLLVDKIRAILPKN